MGSIDEPYTGCYNHHAREGTSLTMNKLFLLFVFLIASSATHGHHYWLLDDFVQQHPLQKKLMDNFSEQIRVDAIPLAVNQTSPVSIAIIYPSRQVSDYWRRSVIAFEARLDALNVKYSLKVYDTKLHESNNQQQKILQKILFSEPDFLVLTIGANTDTDLLEQVLKNKKTKVIIQNVTNPRIKWKDYQPLLYVGFDHVTGTKLLANYFMQHFSQCKFAINDFYPGYISEVRSASFVSIMKQQPNFELISHVHTKATQGDAYRKTLALVKDNPDIKFIYAASTDIAIGTSKALHALQRRDILVNGWGGGEYELKAIETGELAVTVMRMNDDNGVAMAEAIKLVLEGKKETIPIVYSGDFVLVSVKTNKQKQGLLIKRSFRYSN